MFVTKELTDKTFYVAGVIKNNNGIYALFVQAIHTSNPEIQQTWLKI